MKSTGPYKIGTISRMTGVSTVLLRAWENRYGFLRPDRGPGGHRLYTDEDLYVLRRIQELIAGGRTIGEIAAAGRAAILESQPDPVLPGLDGGQTDPMELRKDEVIQAALRLDGHGVHRALDEVAATVSPVVLIERVVEPAAREIGDLWQAGRCSVASEHLASEVFTYRLRQLLESSRTSESNRARLAVAACLPREEHQLGLLILSYFLNRRGVQVVYLGANLPFEDLRLACEIASPGALLLSVTRRVTFRKNLRGLLRVLEEARVKSLFYLGGQGAPKEHRVLEAAGVRLAFQGARADETARRIAQELAASARSKKDS